MTTQRMHSPLAGKEWLVGILALVGIAGGVVALSPLAGLVAIGLILSGPVLAAISLEQILLLVALFIPFRFEADIGGARIGAVEVLVPLAVLKLGWRVVWRPRLPRLPYAFPWAIFVASGIVAHALNLNAQSWVEGAWRFYKTALVYPVIYPLVYWGLGRVSERLRRQIVAGLLVMATLSSVIGIVQTGTGGQYLTGEGVYGNLNYLGLFPPYPHDGPQSISAPFVGTVHPATHVPGTNIFRAHGGSTRHNYFGLILVMTLSLTLALYTSRLSRSTRYWLAPSVVLQGIALAATFSRAAWVAASLCFALIAFSTRNRRSFSFPFKASVTVLIAMAAGLLTWALVTGPLAERIANTFNPSQAAEIIIRTHLWKTTVQRIGERPLVGWGAGGVEGPTIFGAMVTPHNIFLSIAYERGLIGLGTFVIMLLGFIWLSFQLCRSRVVGHFSRAVGLAGLVGLLGFTLAGQFTSPIVYEETAILFWFWVGFLAAEACAARRVGSRGVQTLDI